MLFQLIVLAILCFKNIESTDNHDRQGYRFHSEIQGWLKLSTETADWQTARMLCHDEDAVLAAPINDVFKSTLFEMLDNEIGSTSAIYVGAHIDFPEGVYKYEDGKMVLSLDPADVVRLDRCLIYLASGDQSWVDCRNNYHYVCYAPAPLPQEPTCGNKTIGYELNKRTGKCYKFHWQAQPWNDAHRTCLAEGAHLAIINSETESEVLMDLFAQYPFEKLNGTNPNWGVLAVGFYYWQKADSYVTIHGQTLEQAGYASWSYGNPSSRGKSKELGGGMFRSGYLDDVDKSYRVPFICEMEPSPMKYERTQKNSPTVHLIDDNNINTL